MISLLFSFILLSSERAELNLEGWIALATENSPEMVIASSTEQQAEASYLSARSSLLPSISLNGNTGRTWREQNSGNYESEGLSVSGGISLSANLLSAGGSDWLMLQSASTSREIALIETREAILALQQSIASKYYRAVEGRSNLAVAEGALEKSLVVLQRAEMLYNLGSIAITELLEAQVQSTEARIAVMNKQAELENALELLNSTAGVIGREFYTVTTEDTPQPLDEEAIEALQRSVDNNPSLISAELAVDRAETEVSAASRRRLPSLSANGSYNWSGSGDDPGSIDGNGSFTTGISISVPIFDGWSTTSRVNSARASVLNAEASLSLKRSSIESELHNTIRELQLACETLKLAELNFEYRSRMLELAESGYHLGSLELDELIEAQNNCTDAEYQLVATRIDCLEAEVDYCVLIGLDIRYGDER